MLPLTHVTTRIQMCTAPMLLLLHLKPSGFLAKCRLSHHDHSEDHLNDD
jgi:hypothetical protein